MKTRTAGNGAYVVWWCPGCDEPHEVPVAGPNAWAYTTLGGNVTLSPSILVHGDQRGGFRCHAFMRDGQLEFCGDSTHGLAGQTVPLPEWPYAPGSYGGIDDPSPGEGGRDV